MIKLFKLYRIKKLKIKGYLQILIVLLQPMPGKHTLLAQLDRYSKEFIIARMKLLHIFLNRVVNHPILSCDKNLHIFLTTKPAVSTVLSMVLYQCMLYYKP